MGGRKSAGPIALALTALALGACSSMSNLLDSDSKPSPSTPAASAAPAAAPGVASAPGAPGAGASAAVPASNTPFSASDYECPEVTVRGGASTLQVGGKAASGEPSAMDLRYQGTFVQFSRECSARPGVMSMKVGVFGRIISGPAGGAGEVDVPLRIAVVQEGPSPRTVVSKLVHLPVAVPADTPSVDFTHVDQDVSFPLPRDAGELQNYVVYVGFDPSASAPQKPKPAATRRKR
jgi:hypothetical protein